MKIKLSQMIAGLVLPIWLGMFVLGCSTTPKVDWNNRVGNYTYDQAVAELGKPAESMKTTSGGTTAEWLLNRNVRGPVNGAPGPLTVSGSGLTRGAAVQPGETLQNEYLKLSFDSSGKLVKTDKVYRLN